MAKYDSSTKTWTSEARPGVLNPEANIGEIVLNLLSRTPDKVIQINADTGYEMTCAEMKLRIIRVAMNLKRLGLRKGEIISLVCANSDNVVPVYVGCLAIGLVVSPLAPVFNKEDLAHMMVQTNSKLVFCDPENWTVVSAAVRMAAGNNSNIYMMGDGNESIKSVNELLGMVEGESVFSPEYLGDSKKLMAMVLCSSGTTGLPKGVCISHAHLIEGDIFSTELNAGPIFNFSPLFWATGMFGALTSLFYSRVRIITTKSYNEERLIDIVEKYKIEDIFTPPSYISILQSHPRYKSANFSSVKCWSMGGAMVSNELCTSLNALFPNGVARSVYGSSEIGFITAAYKPCALGSVGILANGVTGKIVSEDGLRMGPKDRGEICVKYKHKFLGYLNNEEATKNAFDEEDFFKTGDIGYFDEHGFLYVIDRIKDIIKYRNYQISPADLETIIEKIEGVKQVCVTGIPVGDLSSDLPTAVIVREDGSDLTEKQVQEIVDGQVSDYKKLRGGVHFVDHLPTSAAGKVLRRLVKEMVIDMDKKL